MKGLLDLCLCVRDKALEIDALAGRAIGQLSGGPADVPWCRDICDELARNLGPYAHGTLQAEGGWWMRRLDEIAGLTFHHTLSNSPHATAAHYVDKGGGRPSIPYSIWVSETGEVLLCNALDVGCWHDHTGHRNTHLSVGLAGRLHVHRPSDAQLDAAARVAAWAMGSEVLPGITALEQIRGHRDYVATACPGWQSAASGNWKDALYERIRALAGEGA